MGIQANYNVDNSIILINQKELIGLQAEVFNKLIEESINKFISIF